MRSKNIPDSGPIRKRRKRSAPVQPSPETSAYPVGTLDQQIMSALVHAPQATNRYIAGVVGVSEVTVANRIDALIKNKVMRIAVQRNIAQLGYDVIALVEITVRGVPAEQLAERLKPLDGVTSMTLMIDDPQIVIVLAAKSLTSLNQTVFETIGEMNGVAEIETSVLDTFFIRPGVATL